MCDWGSVGVLKPYGQVRYRHIWEMSPKDRVEFRETLFYSVADQLGSTTALTYEHFLTPSLTARWLSAITATARKQGCGLVQQCGRVQGLRGATATVAGGLAQWGDRATRWRAGLSACR